MSKILTFIASIVLDVNRAIGSPERARVRMNRRLVFLATCVCIGQLVLSLGLLSACTTQAPAISPGDEAAIYAAIIRHLYGPDDTFGGSHYPPLVYLVRRTDDRLGDPDAESARSEILPEPLLTEISAELEDLPAEFIWVDSHQDVALDPDTGQVIGDGVIIKLGNIHPQPDNSVHVAGSIYTAGLAAGGEVYKLRLADGSWKIVGTAGVRRRN